MVDFAAWTFPVLIAVAVGYLIRMDRDPDNPFRLTHLISDASGQGHSGYLAYTGAFLVSVWALWYVVISGEDQRDYTAAITVLGIIVGAFVAGGVVRQGIGVVERARQAKNKVPPPDDTSEQQ